jgi:hypothetical protein
MAADAAVLTAKTDGFRQHNLWGVHGSFDCRLCLFKFTYETDFFLATPILQMEIKRILASEPAGA